MLCTVAALLFTACIFRAPEDESSVSVLQRVPDSQVCHTFFVPDEHRSFTLDMLELIDLMDSRLEGRTRIISINEARNKFPSLQVPTRLPEGFDLSSVIIDEKRPENDRRAPYLPCNVTLKYTPADSLSPWLEIQHPECSTRGGVDPPTDAAEYRKFVEEARREVTVNGALGHILDWPGRDSLSLRILDSYTCLKVSRDSMLSDEVIIAIVESLERVKEAS